jgi:hypothetical protein
MSYLNNSSESLNYLLKGAIIIIGILSFATTGSGLSLIFAVDNNIIGLVMAWAFALAITSIIVFVSWTLPEQFKNGKVFSFISLYIFFASISFFFSFNSVYSLFQKENLRSKDLNEMMNIMTKTKEKSLFILDSVTGYSKAIKKVERLKKRLDDEEENRTRPGRGGIWNSIYDSLTEAKADTTNKGKEYRILVNKITSIYNKSQKDINKILLSTDYTDYKRIMDESINYYKEIVIITQNQFPSFKEDVLPSMNKDKPDYALNVLYDFLTFSSKEQTLATFLALFISFLLEFPLFFFLVILNWPKPRKKRARNTDIFGDPIDKDTNIYVDDSPSTPNVFDKAKSVVKKETSNKGDKIKWD